MIEKVNRALIAHVMPVSGTEAPSSENQGTSEEAQQEQALSNNQAKPKNQQNQQDSKEKQQQLSRHSRTRLKNAQRDPKEEARAEEEKKKRPLRLIGGLDLGTKLPPPDGLHDKKDVAWKESPHENAHEPAKSHLRLVEPAREADAPPSPASRPDRGPKKGNEPNKTQETRQEASSTPEANFMDLLTAFQHHDSALEQEKGKKIYLETSQKLRRVGKTQKGVILDTLAG